MDYFDNLDIPTLALIQWITVPRETVEIVTGRLRVCRLRSCQVQTLTAVVVGGGGIRQIVVAVAINVGLRFWVRIVTLS